MRRIQRIVVQAFGICAITAILVVVGAELLLAQFFPQVIMFPRWESSAEYGVVLPRDVTMHHYRPSLWEFNYVINTDRCRGPLIPASRVAQPKRVVTLGDSYTMGMGADTPYPEVLSRALGDHYRVLNCGSPGWGLPHEVRRYYEFAEQYNPAYVVLQFCANDPEDGQRDAVARATDGKLTFHTTTRKPNRVFNTLSNIELLQQSQIYALIRSAYESRRDRRLAHADATPKSETDYVNLLDYFANDLESKGIPLYVIAVNGQLDEFPHIKAGVLDLDQRGLLDYVEVADWFDTTAEFASPEGHRWGDKAHEIIGQRLADHIRATMPTDAIYAPDR